MKKAWMLCGALRPAQAGPGGPQLGQVDAPYKRVVWFERSAHMVPWEERGKTLASLLEFVRPLAR